MENIEATDSNANIVYVNMEVDDFSHDVIFGQNKDGIMQKNLLEFYLNNAITNKYLD